MPKIHIKQKNIPVFSVEGLLFLLYTVKEKDMSRTPSKQSLLGDAAVAAHIFARKCLLVCKHPAGNYRHRLKKCIAFLSLGMCFLRKLTANAVDCFAIISLTPNF